MGLDGVELIMEVEDRFGINIPDAEAERIRTVGDLTRTVQRKVGIEPTAMPSDDGGCCLTAAAFYRLRRAWATHAGLESARLKPSTTFASLSAGPRRWWARRKLWKLAPRAGVRLPALSYARGTGPLALFVIGIGGMMGLIAALASGYYQLAWLSLMLAGVLALCLRELLTGVPPEIITVADAIRACPQPRICAGGQPGLSDLEREVVRMVGEQLGYDPRVITLESRFVEDLDMD